MKPQVYVSIEEFVKIAELGRNKVIVTGKRMLMGHLYVTSDSEYTYCAQSPERVPVPKGIEVIEAIDVQF